jgi:translation initiation factor RLI1
MIGAIQPSTAELKKNILSHCPIVRMGKGNYLERHPDGQVYVVPPDRCIGCGICVAKNPEAVMMVEYAW